MKDTREEMLMLKDGFYTALGTPVDEDGNLVERSLVKHIEDQIEAGASGLLLMGSMGIEPYIKQSQYGKIAKVAADTVRGRCSLFVGAMDNSVWRVKERLDAIGEVNIDGIVVTTPYYNISPSKDIVAYFKAIADTSRYPVYLYDLPGVTKMKISLDIVSSIIDDSRFAGIKSGDLLLNKQIIKQYSARPDFSVLFSTLDLFDVAYHYGIAKNLDGMFSCTPKNAMDCYKYFAEGSIELGSKCLENIISLRNVFATHGIFPSFTVAMNLLGYEGSFGPDYMGKVGAEAREHITNKMKEIGEI